MYQMEGESAQTGERLSGRIISNTHTLWENSINIQKDSAIKMNQSLHSLEANSKL